MTRVGPSGTRRGRPGSRWDRWLASWRFALRLGRREVRRRPGRSALIMALVGTPVLLITAFLTFFTTQDISVREGIDRELGHAVAAVTPANGPAGHVLGVGESPPPGEVRVAQGYSPTDPWDGERVAATVGAEVSRVGRTEAVPAGDRTSYAADDGIVPLRALVLEGPPSGVTRPLVSLREGHWTEGADEILVTPAGVARGFPTTGRVDLQLGQDTDHPQSFTVVGVADAAYSGSNNAEIVLPAVAAPEGTTWQWLVDRAEPVGLEEALGWAAYGLDVTSRQVLLDPPREYDVEAQNNRTEALYFSMVGLAVLAETVLLAGPAFAVSAARQRHSLALAGAQGASRADVRRAVVAHGLVLAVLATVSAAVLGAAAGLGGAVVLARLRPDQHVVLEMPWLWVGLLMLTSVLAAGVAAWWPARGATRLDIMSVLRGQAVSRRVGRGWPLLGCALVLVGAGLLGWSLTVEPYLATWWVVGGAVLLGLGAMALVPSVLALLANLSARAPLPWRLAARDSVRQRSRAVPAVLAIVAAIAVMTGLLTSESSSTANRERQYTPSVPFGTLGVATGDATDRADDVREAVDRLLPGATTYPLVSLPGGPGWDDSGNPTDRPFQTVVPGDCAPSDLTTDAGPVKPPRCWVDPGLTFVAAPVEALERTGALTPAMRETLEQGGLLQLEGTDRTGQEDGLREALAVSAPGRLTDGGAAAEATEPFETVRVPVLELSATQIDALRVGTQLWASGYLTAETAERLGWVGTQSSFLVAGDDSFTVEQASALQEALHDDAFVYLERGFTPDPAVRIVNLVALAVFSLIALAAVVISTALAISEGQQDSATLAAVGAAVRTRRLHATLQAVLVGSVGVGMGMALGLAVGGVMSWVTTSANRYGTGYAVAENLTGIVDVPWLQLGAAAVAVPLLAAVVAWLSVRRAPVLVRMAG
ncbi:FtsX-like permease family protein [Ornithinimicrobium tianjinense]|uniref:ABC3 transporter permease C-terminal domain-containing protein n=1 Tax=Ornithinimicrobium tianjinense TaxID=1195761 RepID=A0A917BGN1_9MICO|nr:FtsX-like permease family protein [Ornithinimicrobium tianjinense]GGF44299.1 hypothetical protein GCM10011366_10010 [Ornithinimicrobium tianjinense]